MRIPRMLNPLPWKQKSASSWLRNLHVWFDENLNGGPRWACCSNTPALLAVSWNIRMCESTWWLEISWIKKLWFCARWLWEQLNAWAESAELASWWWEETSHVVVSSSWRQRGGSRWESRWACRNITVMKTDVDWQSAENWRCFGLYGDLVGTPGGNLDGNPDENPDWNPNGIFLYSTEKPCPWHRLAVMGI